MKIAIPVKCHNGHKATAYYRITGLDAIYEGVPREENCACPKWDFGMGWFADGPPKIVEEPKQKEEENAAT